MEIVDKYSLNIYLRIVSHFDKFMIFGIEGHSTLYVGIKPAMLGGMLQI